jgi:hypothetical protein
MGSLIMVLDKTFFTLINRKSKVIPLHSSAATGI